MLRHQTTVRIFTFAPLVITLILWLLAKTIAPGRSFEETSFPQAISQITSLWAHQLLAIALLISARSRTVERFYGGLDKSYRTHILASKVAMGMILVHPILLIPVYIQQSIPPSSLFLYTDFWPRNVGITSYYLLVIFVALSLWRFMDYQKWLSIHRWVGVAFVLASIHAIAADSDVKAFEPLRDWVAFWSLIGGFAWFYKAFLYRFAAKQFGYQVESHRVLGTEISEINLVPTGARMNYEPGEFAFMSVRGNREIPDEPHPFTISSDPAKKRLRFSYRVVGDYTRLLNRLSEGDQVQVYGPYGEFSSYNFDSYKRQVWIGGGIGITPFLSMLSHEIDNEDEKEIWLIYDVKNAEDAVYDEEIRSKLAGSEDRIHYRRRASSVDGFLTGQEIKEWVGDTSNLAVLLCGPPKMMSSLSKQMVTLGMARKDIHFEEFNFV